MERDAIQPITGRTDTPQPSTQTRNTGSKWPLWGGERVPSVRVAPVGPSPVGPGAGGAFLWEWGSSGCRLGAQPCRFLADDLEGSPVL